MTKLSLLWTCAISVNVLIAVAFNFAISYYVALDQHKKLPFYRGSAYRGDVEDYRWLTTLIVITWPIAIPLIAVVSAIGFFATQCFIQLPRALARRTERKHKDRLTAHMEEELRRAAAAAAAKPVPEGAYRTAPERCSECGRVK